MMQNDSTSVNAIADVLEHAQRINSKLNSLLDFKVSKFEKEICWFPRSIKLRSDLFVQNSKQIAFLSKELLNSLQKEAFGTENVNFFVNRRLDRNSVAETKKVIQEQTYINENLPHSIVTKKRKYEPDISNGRDDSLEKAENGRKICRIPFCKTKAIGKLGFCKKHGGGKRCSIEGCKKASQGRSGKCVSHGGGRRCIHPGCSRLARGKTQLCIPHGGGNRCEVSGCVKLAQGGTKRCIRHGGGKRCKHIETVFVPGDKEPQLVKCTKSAVSCTDFCVAHGGGKRCQFSDCNKGAVGKTRYCVRHGGGKRCHTPGCTKSAVGRSGHCISCGGYR